MSSPPKVCCSGGGGSSCVVVAEEDACRASTSRGLSHSSGDFDDDSQHKDGRCSCCSESYYVLDYFNKPCYIVDSATILHRSKWQTFKNYFKKRKLTRKLMPLSIKEECEMSSKKSKKNNNRDVKKRLDLEENETLEPETSHTPAPS